MKVKKILAVTAILISLVLGAVGQQTVTLTANIPGAVQNVSVYNTGTTGGTYYCYFVVAVYNGGMAPPSNPACTYTSNSTLSGGNFNTVSWSNNPPGGVPIGFWVIRGTSSTFPGTGTTAVNSTIIANTVFTQTDQTNTLNAFTYSPVVGAKAYLYLDNLSYGVPAIVMTDANSNTDIKWYQIGITPPNTTMNNRVYIRNGTVGVDQVNLGATLVPGIAGLSYRLIDFTVQAVGGAVATCTSINLSDTAGTPVVGVAIPQAGLTQNTIVTPSTANVTFTTFAWQGAFTAGKGIQMIKAGSNCATAVTINYSITYQVN